MIEKRDTAVAGLVGAMSSLYPEQVPELLRERALEIAKMYQKERFATKKELNSMSQIMAEASNLFPPDFVSATPDYVAKSVANFFRKK